MSEEAAASLQARLVFLSGIVEKTDSDNKIKKSHGFFANASTVLPTIAKLSTRRLGVFKQRKIKKAFDMKHIYNLGDVVSEYLQQINAIYPDLPEAYTKALDSEVGLLHTKIGELYKAGLDLWKTKVEEAAGCASHGKLDTSAIWASEHIDAQKVMEVCNSAEARALKDQWTSLADMGEFNNEFQTKYEGDVLTKDFFTSLDQSFGTEAITEQYNICRNKVGEFVAARAMYRVLGPNQTRAKLVESAKATIEALEAEVPAKLGLMLQRVRIFVQSRQAFFL